MNMPQDPILLMSLVNTLLRDQYASLEALCEDRGFDERIVLEKLESAGFAYQADLNQFR